MDGQAPGTDQAGAQQAYEQRINYLAGCAVRTSARYPECFIVQHAVARHSPDDKVFCNIEEDITHSILKLLFALPHGLTRGRNNVHSQARRVYLGDSVSIYGYAHPSHGYTITPWVPTVGFEDGMAFDCFRKPPWILTMSHCSVELLLKLVESILQYIWHERYVEVNKVPCPAHGYFNTVHFLHLYHFDNSVSETMTQLANLVFTCQDNTPGRSCEHAHLHALSPRPCTSSAAHDTRTGAYSHVRHP